MRKPLLIPGILCIVADFLPDSKPQWAALALVCRPWNIVFSSILYRSLEWTSSIKTSPSAQGLRSNYRHVRRIKFQSIAAQHLPWVYLLHVGNLRSIDCDLSLHQITGPEYRVDWDGSFDSKARHLLLRYSQPLMTLVERNSRVLEEVVITFDDDLLLLDSFLQLLDSCCTKLRVLKINHKSTVIDKLLPTDLLLRLFKKVEVLDMPNYIHVDLEALADIDEEDANKWLEVQSKRIAVSTSTSISKPTSISTSMLGPSLLLLQQKEQPLPQQFFKLESLSIGGPKYEDAGQSPVRSPSSRLDFIRRCPMVKALALSRDPSYIPDHTVEELLDVLVKTCTRLERLELFSSGLTDQGFAEVLNTWVLKQQVQQRQQQGESSSSSSSSSTSSPSKPCYLQGFGAPDSSFGRDGARVLLDHHKLTLTYLNLKYCKDFTSGMVFAVLTSCPNLVHFYGHTLMPKYITSNDERDQYQGQAQNQRQGQAMLAKDVLLPSLPFILQEWVCTRLETFDIQVDPTITRRYTPYQDQRHMEELRKQWSTYVLEQLGRLTRLRRLAVGQAHCKRYTYVMGLDFNLPNGLGLLKDLWRLECLDMSGLVQQLGLEDIRWMLQHWPNLQWIEGDVLFQYEEKLLLEKVLWMEGRVRCRGT
ncbi:hypothetical protein BX616_003559 [Lobosporangium transversale]|uniref:Uncharacterized protein n=1 Tax=Lobosporangium transversale TaxID=64571 RepID=A0A1Y2GT94_9FUNG|nr:hypothetical protein BCR41DRAFT_394734 [Lobosporangium transversale]KAF9916519.1 hypothetical protein BX616_003559 [Lobosporangium transversale]ORZ20822.1 hypothetical protein BCR41DRAFT_394734 [Lobosporangium transversale]|eukprot:XP_021882731.1 hypothetical protein BCR41DRAFT_394734 [Lobosporangium transversale]